MGDTVKSRDVSLRMEKENSPHLSGGGVAVPLVDELSPNEGDAPGESGQWQLLTQLPAQTQANFLSQTT